MRLAIWLLLAALSGCITLPVPATVTMLDEETGVSIRRVAEPIVLARDRREVAAHARDYLTLIAVELNRSGQRQTVLLVYRWSTIDRRMDMAVDATARDLVLVSDGRDVWLRPLADPLPPELRARADLLRPEVSDVVAMAYGVDEATLRLLGEGDDLVAAFRGVSGSRPFRLWRDGRAALNRFIAE
jgi:hypothetical protein